MVAGSQTTMVRGDWDTTQLLDVVHPPHGQEKTLGVPVSLVSNKDYTEIVRRLRKEDAANCVAIDQPVTVCRVDDKVIGPNDSRKPQNLALLHALGSISSTTAQLPHTVILSNGLGKSGDIAVACRRLTDTWPGRCEHVPITRSTNFQDERCHETSQHSPQWSDTGLGKNTTKSPSHWPKNQVGDFGMFHRPLLVHENQSMSNVQPLINPQQTTPGVT